MRHLKETGRRKHRQHILRKRLTYVSLTIALILICLATYFSLNPPNQTPSDSTSKPKAAIVDHLSISQPNQTFSHTCQAILNQSGFKVDYYPGEDVTVDFYRNLPLHDYKLIIFRVHSTGVYLGGDELSDFVVFFTSELYSNTKDIPDQIANRLVRVRFAVEGSPEYFGITPLFVKYGMNGRFQNTVVIAMGCDGLMYTTMAEAFIENGAKAYISWNGYVTAQHTDLATTRLLHHLTAENQTIEKAVTEVMNEVGPDPAHKSVLLFYPVEAGSYIIIHNTNNIATNAGKIHIKFFKRNISPWHVPAFSSRFSRLKKCCS